jgi:hypothetical protein
MLEVSFAGMQRNRAERGGHAAQPNGAWSYTTGGAP